MNEANLLVAALENDCVKQIFGVPREGNLDIVEAPRRSTIELSHHEADRRRWRLPGDAGPGPLNLTTDAAYALPTLRITGQTDH